MMQEPLKLNKYERYKQRMKPYDFFTQIDTLDFNNLSNIDRYYIENFGIINLGFAEDEFAVRIKLIAGQISIQQLNDIAKIAKKNDASIILTARAGLQIHGLTADNVLGVFEAINNLEVTTWQSISDNVRSITTDIYDGVTNDNIIHVTPIIEQMHQYVQKKPNFMGMLPRRISVGISANKENTVSLFSNDLYFALAKKNDIYGFNIFMGGKNSEIAQDADIFLKPDEVFLFYKAFLQAFIIYGYRGTRSKTRLFHLLQMIGIEKFKQYIQIGFNKKFISAGELNVQKRKFSEFEKLKDGSYAYCYQSDYGRISIQEIQNICNYAAEQNLQIKLGIDQNIYLFGIQNIQECISSPNSHHGIIACAGSEYCPFSFWNIKDETSYLPIEMIKKHGIKIGFSGCAKGCGRHRHVDIGLLGLKTNNFGDAQGGVRVFIGAQHSNAKAVAKELFAMVVFEHLNSVITLIILLFEKSGFDDFEQYSEKIINRYSSDFLALWYLSNLYTKKTLPIPLPDQEDNLDFGYEKKILDNKFRDISHYSLIDNSLWPAISAMSKELWSVNKKTDLISKLSSSVTKIR